MMPTPTITDAADRQQVAALSAAVDAAGTVVTAADSTVAAARSRLDSLTGTLAEHDAARPADEPDGAAELSATLAANPDAARSDEWTGKLIEEQAAQAAALSAWQGKRTIIAQAVDQVTGELEAARGAARQARDDHEAAWATFVVTARETMTDEVERQFAAFYAASLGPVDALNCARRLYSSEPVQAGVRRGVTADSLLAIGTPRNGSIHHDTKLYPVAGGDDAAEIIRNFRASLAAESLGKARSRG